MAWMQLATVRITSQDGSPLGSATLPSGRRIKVGPVELHVSWTDSGVPLSAAEEKEIEGWGQRVIEGWTQGAVEVRIE